MDLGQARSCTSFVSQIARKSYPEVWKQFGTPASISKDNSEPLKDRHTNLPVGELVAGKRESVCAADRFGPQYFMEVKLFLEVLGNNSFYGRKVILLVGVKVSLHFHRKHSFVVRCSPKRRKVTPQKSYPHSFHHFLPKDIIVKVFFDSFMATIWLCEPDDTYSHCVDVRQTAEEPFWHFRDIWEMIQPSAPGT